VSSSLRLDAGNSRNPPVAGVNKAVQGARSRGTPREIAQGERPRAEDILWAVPKLVLTPSAKLLLLAVWWCESNGELHEVNAANATIAEWAGISERSARGAKRRLHNVGYIQFMFKSRGRAERDGRQTDVFRVDWCRVFADANAVLDGRRSAHLVARDTRRRQADAGRSLATAPNKGARDRFSSPEASQKGEELADVEAVSAANMVFTREEYLESFIGGRKSPAAPRETPRADRAETLPPDRATSAADVTLDPTKSIAGPTEHRGQHGVQGNLF